MLNGDLMEKCNDVKCAVHGSLKVHGKVFTGNVIRDKAKKTVVIEMKGTRYVKKYERQKKIRSRIAAYAPECMDAKLGDKVSVGECRKLSKTKSFVVTANLSKSKNKESEKK